VDQQCFEQHVRQVAQCSRSSCFGRAAPVSDAKAHSQQRTARHVKAAGDQNRELRLSGRIPFAVQQEVLERMTRTIFRFDRVPAYTLFEQTSCPGHCFRAETMRSDSAENDDTGQFRLPPQRKRAFEAGLVAWVEAAASIQPHTEHNDPVWQ
jgi:hypothetical protein